MLVGFLAGAQLRGTAYWTHTVWDAGRVGGIEYVRNQSVNGVLTRLLGDEPSTALWFAVAGAARRPRAAARRSRVAAR